MFFKLFRPAAAVANLTKNLPKLGERMQEIQRTIDDLRVAVAGGSGTVTVVATGAGRIESITLQPEFFTAFAPQGDEALAGQVVCETVNAALDEAQHRAQEHMDGVLRDLDLPFGTKDLKGLL